MLAIRLQRTGRKGHAQYRVVVQDSRLTPTSERVVYRLGSYNPHTKELAIDKEKTGFYLSNGAQPSDRVARLLKNDGVKLPAWVSISEPVKREIRNPEKLRKHQPEEPKEEAPAEPVAEEAPVEEAASTEEVAVAPEAEAATETEAPAEEPATEETPAEEKPAETEKDEKAA